MNLKRSFPRGVHRKRDWIAFEQVRIIRVNVVCRLNFYRICPTIWPPTGTKQQIIGLACCHMSIHGHLNRKNRLSSIQGLFCFIWAARNTLRASFRRVSLHVFRHELMLIIIFDLKLCGIKDQCFGHSINKNVHIDIL